MRSRRLFRSGPAYIYIILEVGWLRQGCQGFGLPARRWPTLLAATDDFRRLLTVVLENRRPSGRLLKDAVTTGPARDAPSTALWELGRGQSCGVTLIKAVVKAAQRAKRVGQRPDFSRVEKPWKRRGLCGKKIGKGFWQVKSAGILLRFLAQNDKILKINQRTKLVFFTGLSGWQGSSWWN